MKIMEFRGFAFTDLKYYGFVCLIPIRLPYEFPLTKPKYGNMMKTVFSNFSCFCFEGGNLP